MEDWLLTAAEDADRARSEWNVSGIALLRCGGVLAAIRLPAALVWCAAETEMLREVDDFLRQAVAGPVVMDLHSLQYYALVPERVLQWFPARDFPGAACLDRGDYLGVPDVGRTVPRDRSYWCVPMDSPGVLCSVETVEEVARKGRARMVEGVCR
ncbi:hypothetical protein ACFVH9_07535 [Streptomyces hirsutus]|uniref:hypothetical protein n=1 Tax=Streptomyces hirsutus TaxID=35620 RepID=UPI003640E393